MIFSRIRWEIDAFAALVALYIFFTEPACDFNRSTRTGLPAGFLPVIPVFLYGLFLLITIFSGGCWN